LKAELGAGAGAFQALASLKLAQVQSGRRWREAGLQSRLACRAASAMAKIKQNGL
jgi:hypothetical protein